MANFDNGLTRIDTSLTNGTPGADNAAVAVAKINANFQQCAPLNGAWLGNGLRWLNGKLTVGAQPGTVLVGETGYTLSDEFLLNNGRLSLGNVPTSKLSGTISVANIGLNNGSLVVGGSGGFGREVQIDTNSFSLAGNVLSLRTASSNTISPNTLALPPNTVAIGSALGGADAVELGPMFSIASNKLNVSLPNAVGYAGISTSQTVGTNSRLLVATTDNGNENLSWQAPSTAIAATLNERLSKETNSKRLYVNPVSGDDSLANRGQSIYSPFKSLERACLEVARSSYRSNGQATNSDTAIYLEVGTIPVDNRPGAAAVTVTTQAALEALLTTNALNYFNPAGGGLIVPRGCSIIGVDVRRSSLIPIYVPDPFGSGQNATALLRLTGNAFVSQFNLADAPNVNRSHHLLRAFEFVSTADLILYYQKVYAAFAQLDNLTGNNLAPVAGETQIVVDQNVVPVDINGFKLVDSANNSSAYIFSVSLRSRFGMSGMYLDGSKVTGVKSMVAAQFTNVSQQVDPNAYQADVTDPLTGQNYKPNYKHFAFKATNDAYAQLVSCFTICSAEHYGVESGGELSITNSCSNFGGTALVARGFSSTSLLQDRGYAGVRLLPPLAIPADEREFIVGTLDTTEVTATEIKLGLVGSLGSLQFVNDSYVYVRVANPANTSATLDLQAKLVSTGSTFTTVVNKLATVNGTTANDENAIYQYLNCIGNYEFQSTWYDPGNPPPGGLAAAKTAEMQLRAQILLNANVFVKRIYEARNTRDRSYRLLITVPSSARAPVTNFVLELAQGVQQAQRFFVTDVEEIDPARLAGDTSCTSLPGKIYAVTLLRVNNTGNGDYSDKLEDLEPSTSYAAKLANLDPRLYSTEALRKAASFDPNSASRLTFVALLSALGYDTATATSLLEPTAGIVLIDRYRCLTNLGGTVINSSFPFDLLRPSRIRCSGHTWEWVGYRNYSTALPALQTQLLSYGARLAAIQASLLGGRVYATGMDEEGALYQGETRIDLASNSQEKVRYDGQAIKPSGAGSSQQRFQDITITGALTAGQANIDNLTVGMEIFKANSQLRVNTPTGLSLLVDGAIPGGLVANPTQQTYGLVRRAFSSELDTLTGNGYISPADIVNFMVPVGAVFPFAGATAPSSYLICQGQSLQISIYPELFAAIGYTHGGSGTTFNLPDLRNRAAFGANGNLGSVYGSATVTLTGTNIPAHEHSLLGATLQGNAATQGLAAILGGGANGDQGLVVNSTGGGNLYASVNSNSEPYVGSPLTPADPVSIQPPAVALNYIIKVRFN
jgi:microcystin-dependent protein